MSRNDIANGAVGMLCVRFSALVPGGAQRLS